MRAEAHKIAPAKDTNPNAAIQRGLTWLSARPTRGARMIVNTAIGEASRADWKGVKPFAIWAQRRSGNGMALMANPAPMIAVLAREKLRSRNSFSGKSGASAVSYTHLTLPTK